MRVLHRLQEVVVLVLELQEDLSLVVDRHALPEDSLGLKALFPVLEVIDKKLEDLRSASRPELLR